METFFHVFPQKGDEIKIDSLSSLSPILDVVVRRGEIHGDWLTRKITVPLLIPPERELRGQTENVSVRVPMAGGLKHTHLMA